MAWRTLLAIIRTNKDLQDLERTRMPRWCPVCGLYLLENSVGELNCPMGHWRSTGDTGLGQ